VYTWEYDLQDPKAEVYIPDWRCKVPVFRNLLNTDMQLMEPDEFPILESRLLEIQDRMQNWKPRKVGDLLRAPYGDRFTYYTQLFALLIALIGITGIVLSIIQTVYAILVANDNSVEDVLQEMAVSLQRIESALGALLNVSEQMVLAIQGIRTNATV